MKTSEEIAEALKNIYESEFGGKTRGRYRISRQAFRLLSERIHLKEAIIEAVIIDAAILGYIVTDLGDDFAVVEASFMQGYRRAPKHIVHDNI